MSCLKNRNFLHSNRAPWTLCPRDCARERPGYSVARRVVQVAPEQRVQQETIRGRPQIERAGMRAPSAPMSCSRSVID
jgi:hypothetical protein